MVKPKEGDRVQLDNGEVTVITPLGTNTPHNFGPASARDTTVFTCERPGGDVSLSSTSSNTIATYSVVQEWVQFMTHPDRNIQHVIVLLEADELEVYDAPGLLQAYQDAGMLVHSIPYQQPGSAASIMELLDTIHAKGERVVAHCTHGMGRSGRVASGWLQHRYGLSADQSVEESLEAARQHGVERMGAPGQLEEWMNRGA